MTNCIGIHCARLLAGYGVDPANACHMLMDEFQLTQSQAETVVEEAYCHPGSSAPEPAGVTRQPWIRPSTRFSTRVAAAVSLGS